MLASAAAKTSLECVINFGLSDYQINSFIAPKKLVARKPEV